MRKNIIFLIQLSMSLIILSRVGLNSMEGHLIWSFVVHPKFNLNRSFLSDLTVVKFWKKKILMLIVPYGVSLYSLSTGALSPLLSPLARSLPLSPRSTLPPLHPSIYTLCGAHNEIREPFLNELKLSNQLPMFDVRCPSGYVNSDYFYPF